MVRDIEDFIVKQKIMTKAQVEYIHNVQVDNDNSFLEILIQKNILNKELLIDFCSSQYQIPILNALPPFNSLSYSRIGEYIEYGYLVFQHCGNEFIVINDLKILPQILKENCSSVIRLIKDKSYFL